MRLRTPTRTELSLLEEGVEAGAAAMTDALIRVIRWGNAGSQAASGTNSPDVFLSLSVRLAARDHPSTA